MAGGVFDAQWKSSWRNTRLVYADWSRALSCFRTASWNATASSARMFLLWGCWSIISVKRRICRLSLAAAWPRRVLAYFPRSMIPPPPAYGAAGLPRSALPRVPFTILEAGPTSEFASATALGR